MQVRRAACLLACLPFLAQQGLFCSSLLPDATSPVPIENNMRPPMPSLEQPCLQMRYIQVTRIRVSDPSCNLDRKDPLDWKEVWALAHLSCYLALDLQDLRPDL